MQKFFGVGILLSLLLIVFSAITDIAEKEKIEAAYEQLDAKGGIARFNELAVVDLESLGGEYSYQELVDSNRTQKHFLKDPATGDLFVGLRVYVGGVGIFRVDEEGKILQTYNNEEFYKLGVVDRLVK